MDTFCEAEAAGAEEERVLDPTAEDNLVEVEEALVDDALVEDALVEEALVEEAFVEVLTVEEERAEDEALVHVPNLELQPLPQ